MTLAFSFVSRRADFAYLMLQCFRADTSLQLYSCQQGASELKAQIQHFSPHVLLLDVAMLQEPDAAAFRELAQQSGTPPVIFVYQTPAEQEQLMQSALDWRALDWVCLKNLEQGAALLQRLHLLTPLGKQTKRLRQTGPLGELPTTVTPTKLLLLGASTGGPQALAEVLGALPASFPLPVVVVQHLPGHWTQTLAERLNALSALRVREARPLDRLQPGTALVIPGEQQVALQRTGTLTLYRQPGLQRPSVDLALKSAVEAFGDQVLAVILTGMGQDGLEGARKLKAAGGVCLAEHASSCVVYGMPRAVIENGLATRTVPLTKMAQEIQKFLPR